MSSTPMPPRPKVEGEAVRRGDELFVRVDGEDRPVKLGANASTAPVTRDSQHASLGDIRQGDQIDVVFNHDGTAYRVDATSTSGAIVGGARSSISPLRRWSPLAFSVAAIGLGLFLSLRGRTGRRSRDATRVK